MSTTSIRRTPSTSHSTRRPVASATKAGHSISSLTSNGKVTPAKKSVDAAGVVSSISVATERRKENVASTRLRCDDDYSASDARFGNRGEGGGGGGGRVSGMPLGREKSPTKLPLPSASRAQAQARDKLVENTRADASVLGGRRRVGLSIQDAQAKNVGANGVSKGSDVTEAGGLRKVGDTKINAAAGRALLRRSSTRKSSCGSAVSNDATRTGDVEKHCGRDSDRFNRKSDNSFSVIRPSRVSSTSSRASFTGRRESVQQPKTSVASTQARRLSHRQSSLRASFSGTTSNARNTLGVCSRNVSLASTVSASAHSTVPKPNNENQAKWRVSGDKLRWNETQVVQSRTIPTGSLPQSRRSTSAALDTEKKLISAAGNKNDNTSTSVQSSFGVLRLQAETLQLHLLHSFIASNVPKKSIKTNRSLRESISSLETTYKAMRSKEQAAQSLINRIALHSWSYGDDGDGDGDGSQADNIALLVTILDEFPALLGSDDEKARVDCDSDSADVSGSQCLYTHLIKEFESWVAHVQQVWQARQKHGTSPEVSSTTSSVTVTATEYSTNKKFANTKTCQSHFKKSPYTITPMPTSWYTDLATLGHKLDILSRSLEELEAVPDGSTLALTLQQCAIFLANARQEIREMEQMEEMVFTLERGEAGSEVGQY